MSLSIAGLAGSDYAALMAGDLAQAFRSPGDEIFSGQLQSSQTQVFDSPSSSGTPVKITHLRTGFALANNQVVTRLEDAKRFQILATEQFEGCFIYTIKEVA